MAKKLRDPAARLPPVATHHWGDAREIESGTQASSAGWRNHVSRPLGSTTGQLLYVLRGEGFLRRDAERWQLARPGELYYYQPRAHQEYGDLLDKRLNYHWVHFHPRPSWQGWLRFPLPCPVPGLFRARLNSATSRRRIRQLFQEIQRDLRLGGPWRVEKSLNAIEAVILLACEENRDPDRPSGLDERVQAALETIHSNPQARLSIPELAEKARLSSSRFAHLFRQQTGQSVLQTIHKARLEEARKLLTHSSKPVSEIAEASGFSNSQYFGYHFKRHFGISPARFRKKQRRA